MFNKATLSLLTASLVGTAQGRPNIIIMQPDDFPFIDTWTGPPNTPDDPAKSDLEPDNEGNGLQHINRLRLDGVEMMAAYTASPVCGTSRFSTITGRMPSRSEYSRSLAIQSTLPQSVTIPTTKLSGPDCEVNNLAWEFQNAGYRTGMIGKWHLSSIADDDYSYEDAQEIVKGCGFTDVEALYVENLQEEGGYNNFSDGTFSHNMEWLTWEAIKFINETVDDSNDEDNNFFMYFNPTVPHSSNDVVKAVEDFPCTNISDPNPNWGTDEDPWITGMSENGGCDAYRQSIITRANGVTGDYGKIWVDDAVGALLHALEDKGVLNNTVFLFQEDHGMDSKGALYEGGIRIPQFIHYPDGNFAGEKFHGLVSTVDIAPTMLDFAGITPDYEFDGKSWKNAIGNAAAQNYWEQERCLFFEVDKDRAVRCGCWKYIDIHQSGSKTWQRGRRGNLYMATGGMLFDLCDGGTEYITSDTNNREDDPEDNQDMLDELTEAMACHEIATNPNTPADYSECPETANPPVAPPTEAPVAVPVVDCEDSPFGGKRSANFLSCDVIANQSNRCSRNQFWQHCQKSCGRCDTCNDSRLSFRFNGQELKCDTAAQYCSDDGVKVTCPQTCNFCSNW